MQVTICTANCVGQAGNCSYPNRVTVVTPEQLQEAVKKDHVCAEFKGNYRSVENFIRSDVIVMDIDNDHTDEPTEWITPEKLEELFPNVEYLLAPSRHHLLDKEGNQNLLMICEQNQKIEEEKGKQEMESKRDILRVIEKEIKKGSAPVAFAGLGFSEECYHLVDSQAKMNQLLDYFFRNEEYAALADRQVKSYIYAEMGKRLNFRSARSDRDRKNMEVAAKRWIKKKHPTFDGDVYVENIRCFLDISQEELEKRKCTVNEQDITALIFSQKHLEALYLQCLMHRRNAMQEIPELKGLSETCNRIYKLQDVDVLFQCLLMDQMDWEEEKLHVQFSTIYMLESK